MTVPSKFKMFPLHSANPIQTVMKFEIKILIQPDSVWRRPLYIWTNPLKSAISPTISHEINTEVGISGSRRFMAYSHLECGAKCRDAYPFIQRKSNRTL